MPPTVKLKADTRAKLEAKYDVFLNEQVATLQVTSFLHSALVVRGVVCWCAVLSVLRCVTLSVFQELIDDNQLLTDFEPVDNQVRSNQVIKRLPSFLWLFHSRVFSLMHPHMSVLSSLVQALIDPAIAAAKAQAAKAAAAATIATEQATAATDVLWDQDEWYAGRRITFI